MQGIERGYCNTCISAVIAAWRSLMELTSVEALKKVRYGKGDTMGLDAVPEIIISQRLHEYDNHSILVTEELGRDVKSRWPTDSDPVRQPLMFFSDPTDRSKFLGIFFQEISTHQPNVMIGELMKDNACLDKWEEIGEKPAAITGATTAITCVRKGAIVFSVLLNYITQTIFIAVPDNVYYYRLPDYTDCNLDKIDYSHIVDHGETLYFPSAKSICRKPEDYRKFVTFLGKSGYRENFVDSQIMDQPDEFLHHQEPGGPARILYLSELQKDFGPIGFILANGEKIIEWIHWLPFAKYASNKLSSNGPSLKVFEICLERPWTKDGILMSTSAPYSIFCLENGSHFLDISRLKNFANPSRFRSMLVITQSDNERVISMMKQYQYREVSEFF